MTILTEPADYITLAEVKTHLGKTTTADDTQLLGFIAAAEAMIIQRVGQVASVDAEDDVTSPPTGAIVMEHRPVISVTSVVELPGGETVPEADRLTGADGWYLDTPHGIVRHTDRFPPVVRITYEAGRSPVPGNIRMAALELAAHLWRGSQHNRDRPGVGEPDGVLIPGVAYAMPYRVRELLGLGKYDSAMPIVA